MRRAAAAGAALVLAGGLAPVVSPIGVGVGAATAAEAVAIPFDFDGDGYADLAVGVPGESLRGKRAAGAVQVLYGSASGITDHDQLWHQGRKGVKGALEKGDGFGTVLTSSDFDADGFADLAIGIPREGIGGRPTVGAVQVLYGSPEGLTASGDQIWHQGKPGVPGKNEAGDRFGNALVSGDFDADGFADLAIGIPGEAIGSLSEAGAVVVLRGSASGLTSRGAATVRQGRDGLPSRPSRYEEFGTSLAAGDVNGDGRDDLVVVVQFDADFLVPGYVELDEASSGVHVILGSATGLKPSGSQFFSPEALGFPGYTYLGQPVLADFDGDGRDDFATASSPKTGDRGVVVLHGRARGLVPAPLAVPSTPGGDAFWATPQCLGAGPFVAGDVTGDGHTDLLFGCAQYHRSTGWDPAHVSWIRGSESGLGATITELSGGPRAAEFWFGLQVLPLSGGAQEWLIVGEPRVEPGGRVGALQVSGAGEAGPVGWWSQDTPKIKGAAELDDGFGVLAQE